VGPKWTLKGVELLRPIPGNLWIIWVAEQVNRWATTYVKRWPDSEKNALGDQLMRATDSIGLNISEGYARTHIKERLHFFSIARGSIEESLYAIRRARDRQLVTFYESSVVSGLLLKLVRGLNSFEEKIKSSPF